MRLSQNTKKQGGTRDGSGVRNVCYSCRDLGSFHRIHMEIHNCLSQGYDSLFWYPRATVLLCTHSPHKPIHIIVKSEVFIKEASPIEREVGKEKFNESNYKQCDSISNRLNQAEERLPGMEEKRVVRQQHSIINKKATKNKTKATQGTGH